MRSNFEKMIVDQKVSVQNPRISSALLPSNVLELRVGARTGVPVLIWGKSKACPLPIASNICLRGSVQRRVRIY